MATAYRSYSIFAGSPDTLESTLTILGTGSAGDPYAKRRLVHPDSLNFPPLTYWGNPDRTTNLDNQVIGNPIAQTVLTAGTTKLLRWETSEDDLTVVETWEAGGRKHAMPAFFFRQLWEMVANPPVYDPVSPVFIEWEPRDRSVKTYQVIPYRITVGGGGPGQDLDISDWRDRGGKDDSLYPGDILNSLDQEDATPTGSVDQTVKLFLKVVAEVVI